MTEDIKALINAWLGVLVDFLRLVGLDNIADELASKIVMPL